eukprot:TRINITY_DN38290_c0_g1_i1.p1 TRINITY_DN38290_c0_g1~~TRINITY_DN38290_c0_g1_i1.p1  ORF type:complete len:532 (+),score=212.81 TRINITY_DN38290_c0_g1_i1:58-1653(+)
MLALLVVGLCAVGIPTTPYPVCSGGKNSSANREVLVYSTSGLNDATEAAVATLAGVVGRIRPVVYRGSTQDPNLKAVVSLFNVTATPVSGFADLLQNTRRLGLLPNAYIVFNESAGVAQRNAAVSHASSENSTIAVPTQYAALCSSAGMSEVALLADTPSAVWRRRRGSFSRRIATVSHVSPILDFAVFARGLAFYADPSSPEEILFMEEVMQSMEPLSAFLGWITGNPPREDIFVSSAAAAKSYVHCADAARNVAFVSQFDIPSFAQKTAPVEVPRTPRVSESKHTVAFLITDGDSFAYDFGTFMSEKWFLNPKRGQVPLGWTMAPGLSNLAPATLHSFYEMMSEQDEFVGGPSGVGYAYPERMANVDDFAYLTAAAMGKASMTSLNIISGSVIKAVTDPAEHAAPFLNHTEIDAVMYYNYFDYAILQGRIDKGLHGKPVIGARAWMCDLETDEKCLFACGPECLSRKGVRELLRLQAKDTAVAEGYSLVSVDAWHCGYDTIVSIMQELGDDGFRFVLPSQFVAEVRGVI